ncbi:MAG: ParB N-terminal domain-containing protein [Patescibacteria group bacterium]
MTETSLREATLPDGRVVHISNVPCEWWSQQDGAGFAHPSVCAPDPDQPRRHIDEADLAELQESVGASGVRESITVTPRHLAPWVKLAPEFDGAFFAIVSGHRRWTSASRAEIEAIPIHVRIYATEADHRLDASLLNSGHKDLSPLEQGYEVVGLREQGLTMEVIAKHRGKSVPHLYSRMSLTRLAPDIQELLKPEINEKKRLAITIAAELGAVKIPTVGELDELLDQLGPFAHPADGVDVLFEALDDDGRRFELQRMLLRVIQHNHWGALRAINLIKDRAQQLSARVGSANDKTERFQPARRRKLVDTFLSEISASPLHDWRPADFHQAYDTATDAELEELLERFVLASQDLEGLKAWIQKILDSRERAEAA